MLIIEVEASVNRTDYSIIYRLTKELAGDRKTFVGTFHNDLFPLKTFSEVSPFMDYMAILTCGYELFLQTEEKLSLSSPRLRGVKPDFCGTSPRNPLIFAVSISALWESKFSPGKKKLG